ncbi:MAG: DUF3784 domain-containing protein [Oscillospiraceae bacterium]|nr:DUF3784 domain-containing protein [Oscillospiraceae bacterium]
MIQPESTGFFTWVVCALFVLAAVICFMGKRWLLMVRRPSRFETWDKYNLKRVCRLSGALYLLLGICIAVQTILMERGHEAGSVVAGISFLAAWLGFLIWSNAKPGIRYLTEKD